MRDQRDTPEERASRIPKIRARRIFPRAIWHLICGGIVMIGQEGIYFWKNKQTKEQLR